MLQRICCGKHQQVTYTKQVVIENFVYLEATIGELFLGIPGNPLNILLAYFAAILCGFLILEDVKE